MNLAATFDLQRDDSTNFTAPKFEEIKVASLDHIMINFSVVPRPLVISNVVFLCGTAFFGLQIFLAFKSTAYFSLPTSIVLFIGFVGLFRVFYKAQNIIRRKFDV